MFDTIITRCPRIIISKVCAVFRGGSLRGKDEECGFFSTPPADKNSVASTTSLVHFSHRPPKLLLSIIMTVMVPISLVRKMEITLVILNREDLTKGIIYKSVGRTWLSGRERMRLFRDECLRGTHI